MLELFNVFKDTNHPGVLCRLCGEQTVDPVYLFLSENLEGECSVADKINLCLPITVIIVLVLWRNIEGVLAFIRIVAFI